MDIYEKLKKIILNECDPSKIITYQVLRCKHLKK
jgi:hypothetical protein